MAEGRGKQGSVKVPSTVLSRKEATSTCWGFLPLEMVGASTYGVWEMQEWLETFALLTKEPKKLNFFCAGTKGARGNSLTQNSQGSERPVPTPVRI